MIVRMSKVEIAGPRGLLEDTLSLLREMGLLQIEPDTVGFIEEKNELYIDSFLPDKDTLTERIFLDDLRTRTEELFSYLPPVKTGQLINPAAIIDTISDTLQRHVAFCKKLHLDRDGLDKELVELSRYGLFLDSVESLIQDTEETPDIDFIGLTLKNEESVKLLHRMLIRHTNDRYELLTTPLPEGQIAGLITVEKKLSDNIKDVLNTKNIPEMKFPSSFKDLSFIEKIAYTRRRIEEVSGEIEHINMQLDSFGMKWGNLYKSVAEWTEGRLSVLKAAASAFETKMCFFIYGWIACQDLNDLKTRLLNTFDSKVLLSELEVREEDLDRVPVIMKNSDYFRPFEIFTRILPIPRYTSYDPTPFIGVFFPVFFGLILGDAGYGIILLSISFFLIRRFRERKVVIDAAKILGICSGYTILFGLIYGEFFGELGHSLFGLHPMIIDRRTAIMPMLFFAISIGVMHIFLGIALSFVKALKQHAAKKALYKFLHFLFILFTLALVASLFGVFPELLTRPIVLAILCITPFLLFTGGLLAPLELLKSMGNIISYARIMAIGLTSVLLAYVANHLAGMTGGIVAGIAVAGLIHLVNIIIGVFSPTIHSLRLHYVEFFNKFIESGGRKFEPFKK